MSSHDTLEILWGPGGSPGSFRLASSCSGVWSGYALRGVVCVGGEWFGKEMGLSFMERKLCLGHCPRAGPPSYPVRRVGLSSHFIEEAGEAPRG